MRRVASMPSIRGMRRSISTTSGAARRRADGVLAVAGGADDVDVGQPLADGDQSVADERLVVDDEQLHAGTTACTRQPLSCGPAVSVPPRSSIRSRMPCSP